MKKHMRIVLLMLLVLFFPLGAGAQSGNITTERESMTVGELMRTIEQQTDYHFSYNKSLFDIARRVTTARRTLSLKEALDDIVQGQSVKYMIRNNYIAIVPLANNSRPQVRQQTAPRTSDVYRPGNPDSDTDPVQKESASQNSSVAEVVWVPITEPTPASIPKVVSKPITESASSPQVVSKPIVEPTPAPKTDIQPEKAPYSDYLPTAIHSDGTGRLSRFALKTNLLYGLGTLTPNLAAEAALSTRWTLEAAFSSNPWNYKAKAAGEVNRKLLHGIVRVEGRYWFCDRFSGHFVGAHALYSEYNVSGRDIPLLFDKDYRYKGNAWGGGIVYGYDLPIGKNWNVEFTVGAGVYQMTYDRYGCLTCSTEYIPQKKTWFGPSRLGVSIKYLIK